MEEVHRLHKDVPFGWVAMLLEALERRAVRKAARAQRPYRVGSRFIRGW